MAFFVSAVDWAGNSTGEGLWDITIDRTAPESNVLGLPPTHQTTAVLLEWLGSDNASGVAFYDLQSKRDLESWIDLQSGISPVTSSLWFIGEPDHIYAFRSRGTDFAGNVETYPPAGDTLTFLASCSLPDSYEPDDTPAAASPISLVTEDQRHNICALQDVDWVRFQVAAGQHYRIIVNALHPTAGIRISLYAVDGSTLLAEEVAPGFGLRTELGWTALASSDLFVKLSHINPAVAGDAVNYSLWVAEGYGSYMPILKR